MQQQRDDTSLFYVAFLVGIVLLVFVAVAVSDVQNQGNTDTTGAAEQEKLDVSTPENMGGSPAPFNVNYGRDDSLMGYTHGEWLQMAEVTASTCTLLAAHNITNLYADYGNWESDGSITVDPSVAEINAAVTAAHAAGLKIYAWIISSTAGGGVLNVNNAGVRATAAANAALVVTTYGFDGIQDDIEELPTYTWADLVSYYNAAYTAVDGAGGDYYVAMIPSWAETMGSTNFQSITCDRLQPMLYDFLDGYEEPQFKHAMDYFLRNSPNNVGLAVGSYTGSSWDIPFATSLEWINEQFRAGTLPNRLVGVDIFWNATTTTSEWSTWDSWKLEPYFICISSYPRTGSGAYSTDVIDDVITVMDNEGLNCYRMSIYWNVSDATRDAMIQHFLDNCDYQLVVCRHVYDPGGGLPSGDSWADVRAWAADVCSTFSGYWYRLGVEPINEYGTSDLGSQMQTLVTAVRATNYEHAIVFNKWNQNWSSIVIDDDRTYMGYHFYMNSWSVSGAEAQMTTALGLGLRLLNTEVGADYNEASAFDSGEVAEVNLFMDWCYDRGIGNAVWMRYGLENYARYVQLGLDFPPIGEQPEEPEPPVDPPPAEYYTVTTLGSTGGTVAPLGTFSFLVGQTFTAVAAAYEDYKYSYWTLDGVTKDPGTTYHLTGGVANHHYYLNAYFAADPPTPPDTPDPPSDPTYYTVNIGTSAGGTTSLSGVQTVLAGVDLIVTVTSITDNYRFNYWLLDGSTKSYGTTFRLTGTANTQYTLQPVFQYVAPPPPNQPISPGGPAVGIISKGVLFSQILRQVKRQKPVKLSKILKMLRSSRR